MIRSSIARIAKRLSRPALSGRPRKVPILSTTRPRLEALEDRTLLSFSAPILSATGVGPSGIAVGDFNGDGKLDVVTANSLSNTVSVLFGRGDGTFQAPVNYAVGTKPQRIAVGSLRGNGLLDIVVSNYNSSNLTVLLNNGNGSFHDGGTVSTDVGPTTPVLADFNSDGKLDLAVACTDGQTFNLDVMLGRGDGTFGPLTQLTSHDWGSLGPTDLVVGDFNRDGKLDLATANLGYSFAYFQGNGDGTFQTGVGSPTGHRNLGIAAADLRGIGILDLISAGDTSGWVTFLRGNGNGTFQAPIGVGGGNSNSVGAADFRGTGKPDIVVVDQSGDAMVTLLNAGDGTFPTIQSYPLANGLGAQGNWLAVGDFNGDGRPDVAVVLTQFNYVSVLLDQADATRLDVSAADTSVAGAPLSVTVSAKAADGRTSANYTGTVHFTSTDTSAVLPSNYTFTFADHGVHTFTVTYKTTGSQTLTVTDTIGNFTGSTVSTVTPAAAHHLAFNQQPGNTVAGQSLSTSPTVRVLDQYGNLVTTDSSNVTVAIGTNPASGTLSGTVTVAATNGIATFSNLSIDKAGTGYTLQATDGSLAAAMSSAFNISAATAHHLGFGVPPSFAKAGQAITPAVQVRVLDQFGNLVTTDSSNVTIAIANNSAGGTLSGTLTVAAVNGVATFSNLAIDKAGAGYTLQATDGTLVAVTSAAFDVSLIPFHLVFGVQPSNTTAGQSIAPALQVRVVDQFDNLVNTDSSSVTLAIAANPANGTLRGTVTVTAVNGVATFSNLSINEAGAGYTLQATDNDFTAAISATFTVSAAAANHLVFSVQPSSTTAGQSITPALQVRVLDQFNNLVSTDVSNVTVAIATNPGAGTLSGTVTVAAVNGVATLANLSIDKAGTAYNLQATDAGLTGALSGVFNVSAAAANHLAFGVQPSDVIAGLSIAPALQLRVLDQFGNLVPTDTANVSVAIVTNPGAGTLGGTVTVAAVNGVATFANLSIDKAGAGYLVQATRSGLIPATSGAFTVVPGIATQLVVSYPPPSSTVTGVGIFLAVTAKDAFGNVATAFNGGVAIAFGNNPGGAVLGGTVSVAAVNGIATFSRAIIDKPGSGYTLIAFGSGLTAASTGAIVVLTPNQAYVSTLYLDVLQRSVESSGLTYWSTQLDSGAPRSVVSQQITHSAEYFATIIRPAYRKFLGREAEAAGLAYWTSRMQSGLTDQQLEAGFIGSAEYFTHAGNTNQHWVEAMYQDLLGRSADSAGETYWLQQLTSGADRAVVAYGFAASTEREGQLVFQDYVRFLRRSAGSSEVAYWVSTFTGGFTNEDIVTGFVSSDEYYRAHTTG